MAAHDEINALHFAPFHDGLRGLSGCDGSTSQRSLTSSLNRAAVFNVKVRYDHAWFDTALL